MIPQGVTMSNCKTKLILTPSRDGDGCLMGVTWYKSPDGQKNHIMFTSRDKSGTKYTVCVETQYGVSSMDIYEWYRENVSDIASFHEFIDSIDSCGDEVATWLFDGFRSEIVSVRREDGKYIDPDEVVLN